MLWVTNIGDGSVSPIDPATNQLVATIQIGGSGNAEIAEVDGAVWVTSSDNGLVQIDPATNTVVQTIALGVVPYRLSAGSDALWVTSLSDNVVLRVDPRSATMVASIAVSSPSGSVVTGDAVWVASHRGGVVTRIDPNTNTVVAQVSLDDAPQLTKGGAGCGWCEEGLVSDGADVWVAVQHGVVRLDPMTNTIAASIPVDPEAKDMTVEGTDVWVSTTSGKIVEIDPETNTVVEAISGPEGLGDIAFVAGILWAADPANGAVIHYAR